MKSYLVRFMGSTFLTDVLIISSDTPEGAVEIVESLKGVLQVFDVWERVLDL